MIRLKYITTTSVTSEDIFYLTQLEEILAPYEELDFVIVHDPTIMDNITLEPDDDIHEMSIFQHVKDIYKYDWVHLELTNKEWKKLGIRSSLWGQHRSLYGKAITYGRWNEDARRNMRDRYAHEYPDIYEHVVGMIHEYGHSAEDKIALVHSFMYGYDKVYTKEEEKRIKPKRFMKQCSIKKLLEALFGKPETILPTSAKRSEETKVVELDHFEPVKEFKPIVGVKPVNELPTSGKRYHKDSNFIKSVDIVLQKEGGYVNDSKDPGGETKYGISKRSYPDVDIKNLTLEKAKQIYYNDYWLEVKADKLPYQVALCVFDSAVNLGVDRTVKIMQDVLGVTSDGIIGPVTLNAMKEASAVDCITFSMERQLFYQSLKTFKRFGKGWTRRNYQVLKESFK